MNRSTIAKIVSGLLAAGVLAVAAVAAFTMTLTIAAGAGLGIGMLFLWHYIPSINRAIKAGNVKFLLWWIRENPIESLYEGLRQDYNRLDELERSCNKVKAERDVYGLQLKDVLGQYGTEGQEDFIDTYCRIAALAEQLDVETDTIAVDLKTEEQEIKRASAIWDLSKTADRVNNLLAMFVDRDPMKDLYKRTALESVQRRKSEAFARTDQLLRRRNGTALTERATELANGIMQTKALPFQPQQQAPIPQISRRFVNDLMPTTVRD